jgi:hypothetical protein
MNLARLKRRFPHPQPARLGGSYCVGNALCAAAGVTVPPFPHPFLVRDALRRLNPALTPDWALACAQALTRANDAGAIAEAWEIAATALQARP